VTEDLASAAIQDEKNNYREMSVGHDVTLIVHLAHVTTMQDLNVNEKLFCYVTII
jgi:hypothetical protein